jgi:hypothetical protein
MKTMIAVRLAASALLVLGGARLALAEPVTFDNLSAAVDWGQFDAAKVPDAVQNLVTVIRPATKQCPTDTMPTMTLDAVGPVPAVWPNDFKFNETGFVCQMSGVQCGFGPGPITATSSHVTVDEERRILTLRCSVNGTNLQ